MVQRAPVEAGPPCIGGELKLKRRFADRHECRGRVCRAVLSGWLFAGTDYIPQWHQQQQQPHHVFAIICYCCVIGDIVTDRIRSNVNRSCAFLIPLDILPPLPSVSCTTPVLVDLVAVVRTTGRGYPAFEIPVVAIPRGFLLRIVPTNLD